MKQLSGSTIQYLPQDYYSYGWGEAKFIEIQIIFEILRVLEYNRRVNFR
jgi:hypothetical protein